MSGIPVQMLVGQNMMGGDDTVLKGMVSRYFCDLSGL